jgi:hypothetical protein
MTTPITLVVGDLYELTCDVVNKFPDRRQRYDWRKHPLVPAGARFIVRDGRPSHPAYDPDTFGPEISALLSKPYPVLERTDVKHAALYRVSPSEHAHLFDRITPHLTWREPSLADELQEASDGGGYPVSDRDLIEHFLEAGQLHRLDITAAIARIKERES